MRIAVYGKGGIGKSTLSANLSAAFACWGKRVLQIGCDPKHDSTRLLLRGQRVQTVLDYLRHMPPEAQALKDVIHSGYQGIACVEAGGPEPGVGCAGRGILSAFSMLQRLGCSWDDYHVVLYDVLGDVVCGGFAVPLRKGFAQIVLVVTSEEFMSLYAANNILRGVRNMDQGETRSVGLVLNRREITGDVAAVERFASAAGVPILAIVPRSKRFRDAEALGKTVVEAFPDSEEAAVFNRLAQMAHLGTTNPVSPMEDDALEALVLGGRIPAKGGEEHRIASNPSMIHAPVARKPDPHFRPYLSKSLLMREPLHGCAFTGAVNTLTQIQDAVTLAHGPRSCVHIAASTMLSSGLGSLRRYNTFIPEQLHPRLSASEMTDETLIHGGIDRFRDALDQALKNNPGPVFVVTTCPAGVIGDDVDQVIREYDQAYHPIIRISTDGNMEGDYLQGIINACIEGAARLIDPRVPPEDDCVNVVAEKNIALNADPNFQEMSRLLHALGLRVNCRFVRRTRTDQLRGFLRASLQLPAYLDHLGRLLRDFLKERFGCVFGEDPFPSGFHETGRWIRGIAAHFNRMETAETLLAKLQREYRMEIDAIRPALAGKRIMLVTYNHDVDWILETAFDLDMEIVRLGIMDYSQDSMYRTRYADRIHAEVGYDPDQRAEDILSLKPHLVLCNYQSPGLPDTAHYDTVLMCPDTGHLAGLALARRWQRILTAPLHEGWRTDEARLLHAAPGTGGRS